MKKNREKVVLGVFVSLLISSMSFAASAAGKNQDQKIERRSVELCANGVLNRNQKRRLLQIDKIPKILLMARSVSYEVKVEGESYISIQDLSKRDNGSRELVSCGKQQIRFHEMSPSLRVPLLLDFSKPRSTQNSLWKFQLNLSEKEVTARYHVVKLLSEKHLSETLMNISGEHEFYYNEDTQRYEIFVKKSNAKEGVEQILFVDFDSIRSFYGLYTSK